MTENPGHESVAATTFSSETGVAGRDSPSAGGASPSSGGALRIWWTPRASLNPLIENSKAGQAVNDLIFQGLFAIREDQTIEPVLAKNITFWENGLQALIILQEGLFFHDGTPVTLEDAAACIMFIINPENFSIYAHGLESVESVRIIDDAAIELRLTRPDRWLAYALTFPIIPAASLNAGPTDLIPGTGSFRMTAYDPDEGLSLARQSAGGSAGLQSIRVRTCQDQSAAMQAMERDELDLVYLDAQAYNRYNLRSSLRQNAFTGNEMMLVSCNTAAGKSLADPGFLLAAKQIIQASALDGTEAADWGESTNQGIPAGSWLSPEKQPQISSDEPATYEAILGAQAQLDSNGLSAADHARTPLTMLVQAQDELRLKLAGYLSESLASKGITSVVTPLTVDLFWSTLESGEYDLALLTAVLPSSPDPTWLYRLERHEPWLSLNLLNSGGTGLTEYDVWQGKLKQLVPDEYKQMTGELSPDPAYPDALAETAARSPWCILQLLSEGLAYGDRVYGQCKPNRYHPYQNVEELWVWSGQ